MYLNVVPLAKAYWENACNLSFRVQAYVKCCLPSILSLLLPTFDIVWNKRSSMSWTKGIAGHIMGCWVPLRRFFRREYCTSPFIAGCLHIHSHHRVSLTITPQSFQRNFSYIYAEQQCSKFPSKKYTFSFLQTAALKIKLTLICKLPQIRSTLPQFKGNTFTSRL